jgi:hypothetical protein
MEEREEYKADQDDKESESVTLTAGGESVTPRSLDMFGITIAQKMFKASIAYTDRTGRELRINLYTQAEAFKDARVKFEQTSYIVDKEGRIVSMGEVNGAWVS